MLTTIAPEAPNRQKPNTFETGHESLLDGTREKHPDCGRLLHLRTVADNHPGLLNKPVDNVNVDDVKVNVVELVDVELVVVELVVQVVQYASQRNLVNSVFLE